MAGRDLSGELFGAPAVPEGVDLSAELFGKPKATGPTTFQGKVEPTTAAPKSKNVGTAADSYGAMGEGIDEGPNVAPPKIKNLSWAADALHTGWDNLVSSVQGLRMSEAGEVITRMEEKYGPGVVNAPAEKKKTYNEALELYSQSSQETKKLAEKQRQRYAETPQRPATQKFKGAISGFDKKELTFLDSAAQAGEAFISNPVGVIADLGFESTPASLAMLASALVVRLGFGSGTAVAAAGGTSSAVTSFGAEYAERRAKGMSHDKAWQDAAIKSGVIGALDAVSMRSAGAAAGAIVEALTKTKRVGTALKEVGKETAKQAGLGAAGEAGGSLAIGETPNPAAVMAEAVGEVFGAPMEGMAAYRATGQKPSAQTVPPKAEEPPAAATPAGRVEPTLTDLEAARNVDLEVAPEGKKKPTLTDLEAARNVGLEQEPQEDPRIATAMQFYTAQGFAEDDARLLAVQDIEAATGEKVAPPTGRVLQRDKPADEQSTVAGKADRAEQQMGETNVPTEVPTRVTESIPDQYGDEMPSGGERTSAGAEDPFARGLDNAQSLVGRSTSGEERERASLEANQNRVASQISQAFNRESYPDLGLELGADWTRQTLAQNPTPQEYEEAAYARLEELGGQRPKDAQLTRKPPSVTKTAETKQTEEKRQEAPAAPAGVTPTKKAPAQLPKPLAGAKPRYAFGSKLFELKFESDIDRAAYISAQATPSKSDAAYVDFVVKNTGMSESEVRAHGKAVRAAIKAQAKDAEAGSTLEIPELGRAEAPAPKAEVTKPQIERTTLPDGGVRTVVTRQDKTIIKDVIRHKYDLLADDTPQQVVIERDNLTGETEAFLVIDGRPVGSGLGIKALVAQGMDPIEALKRVVPNITQVTLTPAPKAEAPAAPAGVTKAPAPEVKTAKDLLTAIDAGGVPLNPAKLNNVARDLGLDVSKSAKPEETIGRIRKAVERTEETKVETKKFAPLELEAARKEDLEVEPPEITAVTKAEVALPKIPKKRAPGGGRKVSETAKTSKERTGQINDIGTFNRAVQDLVKAIKKFQQPTGIFPTEKEYDYAEAVRLRTLDSLRKEIYRLSLVRDPKAGYMTAKNYIRSLKPSDLARVKGVYEGTIQSPKLPAMPSGMMWVASKSKERITGILVPIDNVLDRYEALWDAKAEERKAGTVTKDELFETAKQSAAGIYRRKIEQFRKDKYSETPAEPTKPRGRPKKVVEEKAEDTWKSEKPVKAAEVGTVEEYEEYLEPKRVNKEPTKSLQAQIDALEGKIEEVSGVTEEELGDTQGDLQSVIEDELDEDDRALLANHYGQDTYNGKVQSKFFADVLLAAREGLDAVSSVLHDIIKRLQAGVMAAVMILNPGAMTPPIPIAIPMYETRTVQVRAEVPADAAAKMSSGAKLAYSVLYPAMQAKLKATNKNLIITDKPTARVFIFDPNGKLVISQKVLLGKALGDFYTGNNDVPANRITPAGLYTMGLRDAARGVTASGGNEAKTAGEYDFGKVFVLDKAIDGKYSTTLFHSVWTHEKDAKQRLAALEKEGAEDSRYSFGCINVPKPTYKFLLDTQQDRMDGAALFIVPENPENTIDFINGKAVYNGDIVRQYTEPVTRQVKERVPTTPGKEKVERPSEGLLREGPPSPTIPRTQAGGAKAARRKYEGIAESDLYRIAQQFDMGSDPAIEKASTLIEALRHMEKSERDIQSIVASILLSSANMPALKDVDIVVVEKNTKGLPADVKASVQKGDAVGLFVPETVGGVVYLRGKSYGENNQGVNLETVAHEAFHAIGLKKIEYVLLARKYGFDVDPKLDKAVTELEELMARAALIARAELKAGNTRLQNLAAADAFTDVHEFYAYGMTDPVMKQFLLNDVPGEKAASSGFSNFINALLHLFGIDPKLKTGLKDLVLASHELMTAAHPTNKEFRTLTDVDYAALAKPMKKAKTQEEQTKRVMENLAAAKLGSKKLSLLGDAIKSSRDPSVIKDILEASWDNMAIPALKAKLNTIPSDVLVSIGTNAGIGSLKETYKNMREVGASRRRMTTQVENIAKPWIKLKTADRDNLADAMLASTDLRVDPSKDTSNPELNKIWNKLIPEAKAIYVKARDFYGTTFKLFNALAIQRIEQSNLKGNINDPDTPKGKIAQAIKDVYKAGMSISPYFPLMREGPYWLSFGKGDNFEFYTFTSPGDRTMFIKDRNRENAANGDSRTFEDLLADGKADFGNDIKVLQAKAAAAAPMLKKLFDSIDKMTESDMSVADKDSLKSEVFQIHLQSLPEGSARKQFIHRKNTRGYGRDALKNFIVSGSRIAGQLARAKYAPKIENGIGAARSSIKGMPNKDRLDMFIDELELRAKDVINPPTEEGFLPAAARIANRNIFMYTTTAIKTAVNNLFSLATNGVPTLAKYYGLDSTLYEMGKFMVTLPKQVGITKINPDGSITYTWPSLGSSRLVRNDPVLQKAVQRMNELDIVKQNQTFDVYSARKGATVSKLGLAYESFVRFTGMPFQGTERIIREVMFLTAFKLGMKKYKNFEMAIDKAVEVTDEALFNYDAENMPRAMRKPSVRMLAALKRFSYFTAINHIRNAAQMIRPLKGETRRGAMYAFFGSMGMTGLIGAGIYQMFGVSTAVAIFGMLQGLWNMLTGDGDDDDDPEKLLKEISYQRWFNNVYLPREYGHIEFAGVKLSDVLAKGALSAGSGYDFSSGLSQSSLWFKDTQGTSSSDNAFMNFLEAIGFPIISVPTNFISGIKDVQEGDTLKGWEKLNPSALTRNPAVAYRYSQEGVRTNMLDTVKYADEFTAAQLFMQGLGYKTSGLAETMDMNFIIKREMARAENAKQELLKRYYKAEKRKDGNLLDKVDAQIRSFNKMYPDDALQISGETIDDYITNVDESLLESKRGLILEEKFEKLDQLRDVGLSKLNKEGR